MIARKPHHYRVIYQHPSDFVRPHERRAAQLIADYLATDVLFLRSAPRATPDFLIHQTYWELKSPIGNSKNTIHNNFKTARHQSPNIIFDLTRSKMYEPRAIAQITKIYRERRHRVGRLLIITKQQKILDISDH